MHRNQSGLTIIELLIVITIIGILTALVFVGIPEAQSRYRDVERSSDLETLHSRLEEFYTDNGGYPATISTTDFPGIDPEALIDPSGDSIQINPVTTSQAAALASPNPSGSGTDYSYTAYPAPCGPANCRGYILKSYIEIPSEKIDNPHVIGGIHNN